MLGSLHTSDIRRFIPRLIFQDKTASSAPLFKLDWDSVDEYKKNKYREWIADPFPRDVQVADSIYYSDMIKVDSWKDRSLKAHAIFTENLFPDTLPPEIDEKVKDLTFALSHDYKRAVEHYTRLFVEERTRKWKFDTVIRDRCLTVSDSAINVAFNLISDCMYNEESVGWYRGPYKRIYLHAMQYKFWRLYTGRGLVWDKSDLPKLELTLSIMDHTSSWKQHDRDHQTMKIFNEFMEQLKSWSEEQEKFWDFVRTPEETGTITNEDGVVDTVEVGSIPPEEASEFIQKMKKNLPSSKHEHT